MHNIVDLELNLRMQTMISPYKVLSHTVHMQVIFNGSINHPFSYIVKVGWISFRRYTGDEISSDKSHAQVLL